MALVVAALVYVIAMPVIARTRISASVHNSRYTVASAISLTRATAMRFGRPAVLQIDSDRDRVWVEADTTFAGGRTVVDTLGFFDLAEEYDVNLSSNRETLCFNGQGLGTTTEACPTAGAVIVLSLRGRSDTLVVTPLGRVMLP